MPAADLRRGAFYYLILAGSIIVILFSLSLVEEWARNFLVAHWGFVVDPRGMLTLFDEFRREEAATPQSPVEAWFATHPGSHTRLRATGAVIREQLNGEEELAVQVPSYEEFMKRLRSLPPPDDHDLYRMLPLPGHPSIPLP